MFKKHLLVVTCKACNGKIPGGIVKGLSECPSCKVKIRSNETFIAVKQGSRSINIRFSSHPDDLDNEAPLLRLLLFSGCSKCTYACLSCYLPFSERKELKSHIEEKHSDTENMEVYSCNLCRKIFLKVTELGKHMKADSHKSKEPKGFLCFQCFKPALSMKAIESHQKNHNNHHVCPACKEYCLSLSHHKGLCNKRPCPRCGEVTDDVKEHIKQVHPEELICRYCGKGMAQYKVCKEHEEECSQDEYQCSYCDEIMQGLLQIQEHLLNTHKDVCEYYCEECQLCFIDDDRYQKHLKTHIFHCKICQHKSSKKRFKEETTLKKHEIECNLKFPFECKDCGRRFHWEKTFNRHLTKTKHTNIAICGICRQEFTEIPAMKAHFYNDHDITYATCEVCKHHFATGQGHKTHVEGAHGNRYKCEPCGEFFKTLANYEFHQYHNHSITNRCLMLCEKCGLICQKSKFESHKAVHQPYACKICGLVFIGIQARTFHLYHTHKTDSQRISRSIKCNTCHKVFKNASAHWRESPPCRSKHLCNICGDMFEFESSRDEHETSHKGPYKCSVCDTEYDAWAECSDHMETHGVPFTKSASRKHHCNICDEQLNSYAQYRRHAKEVHQNNLGNLCEKCGMKCQGISALHAHQLRHHKAAACKFCSIVVQGYREMSSHLKKGHDDQINRVTGNQCNTCGKYVRNLNEHWLKVLNTCGKEHLCGICGDTMPNKEELDHHITVHKGPFVCSVCDQSFDDWELCAEHVNSHELQPKKKRESKKRKKKKRKKVRDDTDEETDNPDDYIDTDDVVDDDAENMDDDNVDDETPNKKLKWTNVVRYI